jgi:purine-nucleoside phosphorylase
LAKERECLTFNYDLKFNRGIIHANTTGITLIQERQYTNLRTVSTKNIITTSSKGTIRQDLSIKDQYIAQCARGAYITLVCQPEALYDLLIAAQAIEPSETNIKILNKHI